MKPVFGLLLAIGAVAFFSTVSSAQTVSIITSSETPEAYLIEAAMKRHLRAEGYTVKGGTDEGYVLLVQVIPLKTVAGYRTGVAGAITIGHFQWQTVADLFVSKQCKEDHALAQQIKEMMGSRLMLIETTIGYAGDEERLAEMLSTFANSEIRKASRKVTEFFEALKKYERPSDGDIVSPYR